MKVECIERPVGGNDVIWIFDTTTENQTQDTALTGTTTELGIMSNDACEFSWFSTLPTAGRYLALTSNAGTGTYTAGKYMLTFYGA